jgi:hypothetical protein
MVIEKFTAARDDVAVMQIDGEENPSGSLEAVSPDKAEKQLAPMNPEVRAIYE